MLRSLVGSEMCIRDRPTKASLTVGNAEDMEQRRELTRLYQLHTHHKIHDPAHDGSPTRVVHELSPERAAAWCGPSSRRPQGDVRWMHDDSPLQGPPFKIPMGDGGLYEKTKQHMLAMQHRKQELAWAIHSAEVDRSFYGMPPPGHPAMRPAPLPPAPMLSSPAPPCGVVGTEYSAAAASQAQRWTEHPVERLVQAQVHSSPVRAARASEEVQLQRRRACLSSGIQVGATQCKLRMFGGI
eukprot:TRINITY_DN29340_c0_g1_i2.p1 TRINITY_DN29340_c0_g1~~TRINITY_DN29340_c0_g1_i2.p1  ORF type:complete len:240 (+),score=51.17 TRINITY_DN29340_c0_g1_i2:104-823(+)